MSEKHWYFWYNRNCNDLVSDVLIIEMFNLMTKNLTWTSQARQKDDKLFVFTTKKMYIKQTSPYLRNVRRNTVSLVW